MNNSVSLNEQQLQLQECITKMQALLNNPQDGMMS